MFDDTVLRTHLLDLLHELRGKGIDLILGGGYGLYLKQKHLEGEGLTTLLRPEVWPPPRATNDLDLFLRVEVITDTGRMQVLRTALERLGYQPHVEYMQFVKALGPGKQVKVDLLVGPDVLKADPSKVRIKKPRVGPRTKADLHAYLTEEALAIEESTERISVEGFLSTGEPFAAAVLVPPAFTYMLMKLHAFRDRKDDSRRDMGRHHALDLYRVVAMLTEKEYESAKQLGTAHQDTEAVREARRIVASDFSTVDGVGVVRLREHALFSDATGLQEFLSVLGEVFPGVGKGTLV